MIRIGLVGCGAAVRQLHLPFLLTAPNARVQALADVNLPHAETLSKRYGIPQVVCDYREMTDIDAVLVAAPHHVHVPACAHFLGRGVHVLCEKPLALDTKGADQLLAMARDADVRLAVGVFRRYYPVSAFVRNAVANEWLGQMESVDIEEGGPYDWALQSRFMLEREKAGGGVLVDTGSHTLDRLLWWLGDAAPRLDEYRDNSLSGVETDCCIKFQCDRGGGDEIPVRCELSRTRTLRNTYRFTFSDGVLEVPVNMPCVAYVTDFRLGRRHDHRLKIDLRDEQGRGGDILPYFGAQLADFLAGVEHGGTLVNDASTVRPVVKLIEDCYVNRRPLPEPWTDFQSDVRFLEEQ